VVPSPGPPALARPRSEVAAQLQERIERGKEILNRQTSTYPEMKASESDAIRWRDYNSELLKRLFTTEDLYKEYRSACFPSRVARGDEDALRVRLETVPRQVSKLESIVERLELYPEPGVVCAAGVEVEVEAAIDVSKIFVVHGHDDGGREGVARFLEKIGLTAIILAEQPNRGRTIIEKFVDCAREVGFAVVLLTPDDLGGTAADEAQKSRARQNVIFELGYFVGSLGRGRACLLRKGEVEIPSDLYGVVYTTMDSGNGWKIELARELKAAGFAFDADKVLA
jgi:predicted nucleotide-binding protein